MSSERRRRRSRQRRLRRFLSENRLTAAEGVLASAGLAVGLWLFWPGDAAHRPGVDPTAFHGADGGGAAQAAAPPDHGLPQGFMSVAQASVSMSAKQALDVRLALSESAIRAEARPRLEQVARAMPEIGLPDRSPDVTGAGSGAAPAAGAATVAPAAGGRIAALPPPTMPDAGPRPGAAAPKRDDRAGAQESGALAALGVGSEARATAPPPIVPPRPAVPAVTPPSVAPPSAAPAHSGTPLWVRNAALEPATGDPRPMISIVIDDLGPSPKRTAAAAALEAPLTLAFLPYANGLPEQTAAARAAGHELMVHMPMEPEGTDFPGPGALLTSISDAEFRDRLIHNLDMFDGLVGINNHMGSRLTSDPRRMELVMAELRRRELLFVDSRTTPKSVGPIEALRHGVPFASRDVFLDNEPELGEVLRQLERVELLARRKGMAIGIGHPNEATLQALRRWLPTLAQRGFRLVPVSSIVARNSCVEPTVIGGCGSIREPAPSHAVASQARDNPS